MRADRVVLSEAWFRSVGPPGLDNLGSLATIGISIRRQAPEAETAWTAQLTHPQWGKATLSARRNDDSVDSTIVNLVPELSDADRKSIREARSRLALVIEPAGGTPFRTRKHALRFMRAVLGTSGVCALDVNSMRFWTPDALDDELIHDADVDVAALYAIHAVSGPGEEVTWMHTHGLAASGGVDFDILRPSKDLLTLAGSDFIRSLAFAILEGTVKPGGPEFQLMSQGQPMRLVSVDEFDARGPAAERALRTREDHDSDRCVVCDIVPFWNPWAYGHPRASRTLMKASMEAGLIAFTEAATQVMSLRAQATLPTLREMIRMGDRQLRSGIKAGLTLPDGGREHCWFEIDEIRTTTIVGRLAHHAPNLGLQEGHRKEVPIETVTDWAISLPFGTTVTPRNMRSRRFVEKLKGMLGKIGERKSPEQS